MADKAIAGINTQILLDKIKTDIEAGEEIEF